MADLQVTGRTLLVSGLVLALVGLLLMYSHRMPWLRNTGLFSLPGDMVHKGKGFRIYFPLTACIIISIAASLIFCFLGRK